MVTVPELLIVTETGIVLGRSFFSEIVTLLEMVTILAMMTMLGMVTGPATVRS